MIKYYLRIALRIFIRDKGYSYISIKRLAVAIATLPAQICGYPDKKLLIITQDFSYDAPPSIQDSAPRILLTIKHSGHDY
jgi:hypothetical protein